MAKTNFEKAFEKMTPAQRKRATAEVSAMMGGVPPKKKTTKKKTTRSKQGG